MAEDKFEELLAAWGLEYGGKFRDEPRRWRNTAHHPIARGMEFAPGKKVTHATRQLLGRDGYARRRIAARAAGMKGMHVVPAALVDPVPCRETRPSGGFHSRPVPIELQRVERAVQALEAISMIRALCVRVQYCGSEANQKDKAARVTEELRKLSKGHEGISLNMYREQLGFARVWLHGRLLEYLTAA